MRVMPQALGKVVKAKAERRTPGSSGWTSGRREKIFLAHLKVVMAAAKMAVLREKSVPLRANHG